ncbi:phage antirepressor KilAC domain-containing protein [Lacticaseibacillus saniviri]|nr:phage antirepressor KilAC domain-containing protein [Lacticaseibacillus saniviri]
MNDLQPIEQQGQRVLTTEQIAELYGTTAETVKQNFKRNKEKFESGMHYFLLEGDELKIFKNQVTNSHLVAARTSHLYLWTRRGAARHSKMLGTDQAWDMFDSLEENYFNPQPQLQVPQTLPEALRLAADLADDRDKERNGRLIAEQQVNELKPKADYYDHILANKGLVTTTSIAKNYGWSATRLNRELHDLGVQFNQSGSWYLYSKYQDHGYTHTEPFAYKDKDGNDQVKPKTKWTQKGHIFIYELLKAHGILPMIEWEDAE